MEEKSELNDIILNKGASANNNKKVILAVATLGIILIVVILIMNTISSSGTDNLPQASLQPQQQIKTQVAKPKAVTETTKDIQEEPYFEDVEVIEDDNANETIEQVTQRLKEESKSNTVAVEKQKKAIKKTIKKETKKEKILDTKTKIAKVTAPLKSYYVQVGSFMKYEPNKKFLKSIINKGFKYKYHKITVENRIVNKVLIGPFGNEKKARHALKTIRKSIEPDAFVVKF